MFYYQYSICIVTGREKMRSSRPGLESGPLNPQAGALPTELDVSGRWRSNSGMYSLYNEILLKFHDFHLAWRALA